MTNVKWDVGVIPVALPPTLPPPDGAWVPWGRLLRGADGSVRAVPLANHLQAVATYFHLVASLPEQADARIEAGGTERRGGLNEIDLARLSVLALLCGVGKASAGFQARYWTVTEDPPPSAWPPPSVQRPTISGLIASLGWSQDCVEVLKAIGAFDIVQWGDAGKQCLEAFDPLQEAMTFAADRGTHEKDWLKVIGSTGSLIYDPCLEARTIGSRSRQLFPLAYGTTGRSLPNDPALVKRFVCWLRLADRLASDPRLRSGSIELGPLPVSADFCARLAATPYPADVLV